MKIRLLYPWECLKKCVSNLSDNFAITCLITMFLNAWMSVQARVPALTDIQAFDKIVKFAEKSPEYFYVFLSKSTIKNHISKSYIPVTHRTRQFKHSFSTICDNQSQGIFMKIEFPCL